MVDDTTQTTQQGWLQRTTTRIKEALGIETQQPAWKAISLSHAVPGQDTAPLSRQHQQEWNDKLSQNVNGPRDMTARELADRDARYVSRDNGRNDAAIWNKLELLDERQGHLQWNIKHGADYASSVLEYDRNRDEMSKVHKGLSTQYYEGRTQEYSREYVDSRIAKPAGARDMTDIAKDIHAYDRGRSIGMDRQEHQRPSQATERYEQSHTRVHPEHQSAISHTGAVREATTGNTYHRVDSEERMAKGYEGEAREHKHQLSGRELSL